MCAEWALSVGDDERIELFEVGGLVVTDTCLALLDCETRELVIFDLPPLGGEDVLVVNRVVSLESIFKEVEEIARDEHDNVLVCGDGGERIALFSLADGREKPLRVIEHAGCCGLLSGLAAGSGVVFAVSHVYGDLHMLQTSGDCRWESVPIASVQEPFLVTVSSHKPFLLGKSPSGDWIVETEGERIHVEGILPTETPTGFLVSDDSHFAILKDMEDFRDVLVLLARRGRQTEVEARVDLLTGKSL